MKEVAVFSIVQAERCRKLDRWGLNDLGQSGHWDTRCGFIFFGTAQLLDVHPPTLILLRKEKPR